LLAVAIGDAADPTHALLVARFTRPPRDLRGPFFTLGLGLLIVGVGAVLMSRWIVRPLEHLSRAARALGEGDLRARSGLSRRDEVGEVSRTFDEMAERVEHLVRAEKELLANVSHELRTPLARIRVALDLAVEGDAQAAREALAEIEVDLAELETLLEDVLAAARMEMHGGKATPAAFALRLEEVVPATLVESAAARFRSHHPDRELVVTVDDGLPLVRVDRMLVRRTVDNLLENAHKYSPNADRPVRLRARARDGRLLLDVEDQGMGIPAEDLPHVFTPFFRGERSRSRGAGGVGLGLTLAKQIAEAHGGSIDVESTVAEGTTVRVELPSA
jgi:two-component system, OmpR family, sensor kinase